MAAKAIFIVYNLFHIWKTEWQGGTRIVKVQGRAPFTEKIWWKTRSEK